MSGGFSCYQNRGSPRVGGAPTLTALGLVLNEFGWAPCSPLPVGTTQPIPSGHPCAYQVPKRALAPVRRRGVACGATDAGRCRVSPRNQQGKAPPVLVGEAAV